MEEQFIIKRQRENFKKFMEINGLNANSWAKKAGVTEATIRHYITGRTQSLTSLVLEKLASSMNATIGEVISDEIVHDQKTKEFIAFNRNLMIRTLVNAEEYIVNAKLNLDPELKAKVFMAWYDLAKMMAVSEDSDPSKDHFIESLVRKTG